MTTETATHDPFARMRMVKMKQVCELTGYTPQHIYRLMEEGSFPQRVRLGKNRIAFRLADVQKWFDERPVVDSRATDDDI